jgi:hypothetical protein
MMRILFTFLLSLCLMPKVILAQTSDACALLALRPGWADSLKTAQSTWQISPGTILAVLDQESRFNPSARGAGAGGDNPSRNFGFAQANLRTWNWFLRDTGKVSGARTDFGLSADFVGWHFATMEGRIGAARSNTVAQYLVYKMGEGGYRRGASAGARSLALRVASRARAFDGQLTGCRF